MPIYAWIRFSGGPQQRGHVREKEISGTGFVARRLGTLFLILATLGFFSAASADDKSPAKTTPQETKPAGDESGWQKVFREMAEDYDIAAEGDTHRKFALRSAPVLRWSQPVRGGDDGAVYVWLDEGRPAVIGSIFAWPLPDGVRVVTHEMHALTTAPMRAVYQGKEVWTLEKPALDFKRLPGAPAPAPIATQRLAQMRTLGREFTARSIDRKESEWELRLLGQPLCRYEIKDRPESRGEVGSPQGVELLDGAILSFVQGTDPEILLVFEARRDGTKMYWEYALARFSDLQLIVKHKEAEVWRVGNSQLQDNKAPYFVRNVEQREAPANADE